MGITPKNWPYLLDGRSNFCMYMPGFPTTMLLGKGGVAFLAERGVLETLIRWRVTLLLM